MALHKGEIIDLSNELREVMEKLEAVSAQDPSRLIIVVPGKDGYSASLSTLTENFSIKVDFYRRQLAKLAESLPSGRRKRKNDSN